MNTCQNRKMLIRAAVEMVHGVTEPLKIWLPMLSPPSGTPSISNVHTAFPIFYCCVRDVARARIFLEKKATEAGSLGFDFLAQNILEIAHQCTFADEFTLQFSIDEQIFLSLFRDRVVHGFLTGTSKNSRRIWVVSSSGWEKKEISKAEQERGLVTVSGEHALHANAIMRLYLQRHEALRAYLDGISELTINPKVLEVALVEDNIVCFEKSSLYRKL
jgi:hypothetical protein